MSRESYRKCCKCGQIPLQDKNVSFHRFPKPGKTNILRAKAWAMYCWPDKDLSSKDYLTSLYKKHKMLCSKHFEESCFTDSSKKRLAKFSVPGPKEYVINVMNTLRKEVSHPNETENTENVTAAPVAGPSGMSRHALSSIENTTGVAMPESEHSGSSISPTIIQLGLTNIKNIQDTVPVAGSSQSLSNTSVVQSKTSVVNTKEPVRNKKCKGILKPLDITKVSQLNKREKKLYLMARKSIKEIGRLRKKIKNLSKSVQIKKFCENENVQKLLELNLSPSFIILLQSQLQNCPKNKKGRRYSLDQKVMALTLYKKSPACYRLLRRLFTLPSQSTLNKLLNKVPLKPGVNNQIFHSLKAMALNQTKEENLCVLLFDEMSIRKHIAYNEKLGIIEGFQDHGNQGRTEEYASNALVFMLSGIVKKWKQPVAFYFSGKSVTSDRLTVLIKEVLDECFKIGVQVVGTVCDLSRVNIKAIETLGSTTETPFFKYKEKEIYTILDPPHLLKCLRNLYMKYDIECHTGVQSDGKVIKGTAKWQHLREFYQQDKNNPVFVYAPALTDAHIFPNSKQKMRVKLASQIFSHTVAAGLLARISADELPAEATASATLIEKIDSLFDSLNAYTEEPRRGKKLSINITKTSSHMAFFEEMKEFIRNITFVNCKNQPPSHFGWIRTINAVQRLWEYFNDLKIRSLCTRRLNQDPLENLFGCIRYNCGSNDNPTVGQFIAGLKTAIVSNLKNNSRRRNCEDDTSVLYDNLKRFLILTDSGEAKNTVMELPKNNDENDDEINKYLNDATEAVESITPEAQACAYVCGFIVNKLKINNCSNCKEIFLSSDVEPIHIFTSFKEFNTMQNSLKYVSKNMVHCVEFCARILNGFLKTKAFWINLKGNALAELNVVDFSFLSSCNDHYAKNKETLQNAIFYICIKRYCVEQNRLLSTEENVKSLKRKMEILKNK